MNTIPHLNTDCQEDEGEWVAGNDGVLVYIHRNPEAAEPIATPMADFLATSYRDGEIDAEGADASSMPFGEWQETHGTNGATATVEPKVIYFEEVVS
jgi:hypothetical protein